MEIQFKGYVLEYLDFVKVKYGKREISKEEYYLELLILGVLWNSYYRNAQEYNKNMFFVFKFLSKARTINEFTKKLSDKAKGRLAYDYLLNSNPLSQKEISYEAINKLLIWLDSTGEFKEEVLRLKGWKVFLKTKNQEYFETFAKTVLDFATAFSDETNRILGDTTQKVDRFLLNQRYDYKGREDIIFCGRKRSEYHLNMIGAEILNRAFKEEFAKKPMKVILLPTCMSKSENCKAQLVGKDLKCKMCSSDCNVFKINSAINPEKHQVVLIPHSSNFTEWLKRWKGDETIGLVGVACVLNLLTGGYEMRGLGLVSQCVFLDYCGCKKHWSNQGIETDLNIEKLLNIL